MELIERDSFLKMLDGAYERAAGGEGQCVLITGEAGIGKSSLVRAFGQRLPGNVRLYPGLCDALFTPRPLAPLYDVAGQLRGEWWQRAMDNPDRAVLFSSFLQDLADRREPAVIAFEDIHWADEATLDFIKFLARRINRVRCLFLLTFRDNEVNAQHPLRPVLGQLPPDSVTRIPLEPLSRRAVEALAARKGWRGEDVYAISDGVPFYVKEILAAYSPGVPATIKDSILAVYDRQPVATRAIWDILSVMPSGMEIGRLETMEPAFARSTADSLDSQILILRGDRLFFKHELYRRTIEGQLSPLTRIALNKRILALFLPGFEAEGEWERILHHAEQAQDRGLVVRYAPVAARQAAAVGAHIESTRLLYTAIQEYRGQDRATLLGFYEGYAYECYLTHRIKEAIAYQEKALELRTATAGNLAGGRAAEGCLDDSAAGSAGDSAATGSVGGSAAESSAGDGKTGEIASKGDCIRFLSRLWWFGGNRQQAEHYAWMAIEVLEGQPVSRAKAMAFSNMAQLKMLSNQTEECIYWGEKAIAMAYSLADEEILSHALNNVGDVRMTIAATRQEGQRQLEESLRIALAHSYHEHAARAYTNLGSMAFHINDLELSGRSLEEGIRYCEDRDLDSWAVYMSAYKARLLLRKGDWDAAYRIAEELLGNEGHSPVVRVIALVVAATIRMRRGEGGVMVLLEEARGIAFVAGELQRIIPVMVALLEYEWISGERHADEGAIGQTVEMLGRMGILLDKSEFSFWSWMARGHDLPLEEVYPGLKVDTAADALKAAAIWEGLGCAYPQALALFAAGETGQRKALMLVQELGATAVYQRMSMMLRAAGVKNLPRGARESTRSNAAQLTQREIEVLRLLREGMKNKEIAARLYISPKTVDHHISALLFKLDVDSRAKAVNEAVRLGVIA